MANSYYHWCHSNTHKEIWIIMFDEETTQSPLSVEQTCNNHHMALNFTTSLFNSALVSKRNLPDYCSMNPPKKRSSKVPTEKLTISLAQEAVN